MFKKIRQLLQLIAVIALIALAANYYFLHQTSLPTLDNLSNSIPSLNPTASVSGSITPATIPSQAQEIASATDSVKVANWNLQIFGQAKAGNESLIKFYSDVISEYDVVFVQEIRDSDATAFDKLCSMIPTHYCVNSSRAGRTSSKEQYGVVYRKTIALLNLTDFNPDPQDRWERPPVKAVFNASGLVFSAYNIHVKPEDVKNELSELEKLIDAENQDVIVLGDLNADCSYYDAAKNPEFDAWTWAIKDSDDTTVAASSCAYDRILLNSGAAKNFASYGIYSQGIVKEVSDHYLVWVALSTNASKLA